MNDDELVKRAKRAFGIIEKADVPTDLRHVAFESVWRSISPSEATVAASEERAQKPKATESGTGLQALAAKLSVEVGLVSEIFQQREDGTLAVHVPTSSLGSSKSAATREIALLVCAARQYGGDEWTDAAAIRSVCQEYGKFDSANNASILAEGDRYWMTSGTGKSRRFKLRRKGWEEAADLVRRIAGE